MPCCWDSRKPIASVEFKFVARLVVASVVIRAAKPKFVAESRTRFCFAQHVASTCNTLFCCETSWYKHGNTRNNVFQLAMQQCCKTSWRKMLPVLPDLNSPKVVFIACSVLLKLPYCKIQWRWFTWFLTYVFVKFPLNILTTGSLEMGNLLQKHSGMLVHRRVPHNFKFASTYLSHIKLWVKFLVDNGTDTAFLLWPFLLFAAERLFCFPEQKFLRTDA